MSDDTKKFTEAELLEIEAWARIEDSRIKRSTGYDIINCFDLSYLESIPRLVAELRDAKAKTSELSEKKLSLKNEVTDLISRLTAAQASAGQMRAALKAGAYCDFTCAPCVKNMEAALATDAGRGWKSPEEVMRLEKDLKDYKDAAEVEAKENNRLRREVAQGEKLAEESSDAADAAHAVLDVAFNEDLTELCIEPLEDRLTDLFKTGRLVLGDECTQRCKKVGEKVLDILGQHDFPYDLDAIVKLVNTAPPPKPEMFAIVCDRCGDTGSHPVGVALASSHGECGGALLVDKGKK